MKIDLYRWRAREVRLPEAPKCVFSIEEEPPVACRLDSRYPSLADVRFKVEPALAWDVNVIVSAHERLADRCALAALAFEDGEGRSLPAPESLAVSDACGPYRYLREVKGAAGIPPEHSRLSASFPAAPGTAAIRVTVVRWKAVQGLAVRDVQICPVHPRAGSMAEGTVSLHAGRRVMLSAQLDAPGAFGANVARLVCEFFDPSGQRLEGNAQGLAGSERFRNFRSIVAPDPDIAVNIPVRVAFVPPEGAVTMTWHLAADACDAIRLKAPPVLVEAPQTPADLIAALPAAARLNRLSGQTTPERTFKPTAPWASALSGQSGLLAEALSDVAPDRWMKVGARLTAPGGWTQPPSLFVHPVWFNASGKQFVPERVTGCATGKNPGLHRLVVPRREEGGQISICEPFLPPPNAASAAFYLFAQAPVPRGHELLSLSLDEVEPDAVLGDVDTALPGRDHLWQLADIANAVWDLPMRRRICGALALSEKGDKVSRDQAEMLDGHLADLNPRYLPKLPHTPVAHPDPMKVLHLLKAVYPDENSGGAVRSTSMLEAQAARGMDLVACMPLPGRPVYQPAGNEGMIPIERNGVRYCYPRFGTLATSRVPRRTALDFEAILDHRILLETGRGLVHASSGFRGYEMGLKGMALAQAACVPFVYEVRSFHEHTWRLMEAAAMGDSVTHLRSLQENRCMAAADVVVTISQAMAGNLRARGVPAERLFVVPNAISSAFHELAPVGDVARLRHRYGLVGCKTIGYVSNMSQREGHRVLAEAFAHLVDEGEDLTLILVGDGPEREAVREFLNSRGMMDRVVMPGMVDHAQIRAWYRAIDLFIVPRIEDFASDYVTPLKPFEAMSQAVPMMMSERPVTREIAGEAGERAVIFPPNDPVALARSIRAQFRDPGAMRARAKLARDWVFAERTWEHNALRYEEIYRQAARLHAQRGKRGGR